MPWAYSQRAGEISLAGEHVAFGYSGYGIGKNNPDMQDKRGVGPIPIGRYTILPPEDTLTHGPFVMPLKPDPANEMFGRSGFLIHGDSIKLPGTASHGCIILARWVRSNIWASGDRILLVTKE